VLHRRGTLIRGRSERARWGICLRNEPDEHLARKDDYAGTFLWVRWLIAATILSSQLVLASAEVANGLDAPRNLDDVPEVALA
jgi:hypothetical protein